MCAVLSIDTSQVESYVKWLESEMVRVQTELRMAYRAWAVKVFASIVELSPQWSGNLAANWAIDVNSITTTAEFLGDASVVFHANSKDALWGREPYSRGMQPAVGTSMARAAALPLPELGDTLYIHNPVEYAEQVEMDSGERRIRPINRVPIGENGKIAMVYYAYVRFANEPA